MLRILMPRRMSGLNPMHVRTNSQRNLQIPPPQKIRMLRIFPSIFDYRQSIFENRISKIDNRGAAYAACGEGRIRTSEGVCRQIYSLFPLAAREPLPRKNCSAKFLSRRPDSNRRPADYKSAALPTELRRRPIHIMLIADLARQLTDRHR